ncbi:MAG: hypothetical protein K6G50_12905 [bacterium]|nr:hypothetical protein [bacterium]
MSKFCFACNNEYDGDGDMCPVCGNMLGTSGIQEEVKEERQKLISCMMELSKLAFILLLPFILIILCICHSCDRDRSRMDKFYERHGGNPSINETQNIDRPGNGKRYDFQPTR